MQWISNILDCLMCDYQEQRPFYFGLWQTCIIYRQLEDALQADEQVNKDRLVALGIEDRHPLRKRGFIVETKIRRGSVAPMCRQKRISAVAQRPGVSPLLLRLTLSNSNKINPFHNIFQFKFRLSLHCLIDMGTYSQYLAFFAD